MKPLSTEDEVILSVSVAQQNQSKPRSKTEADYEEYEMNSGAVNPIYAKVNKRTEEVDSKGKVEAEDEEDILNYENIDFGKVQKLNGGNEDVVSDEVTTDFSTDSFSPMPPARKKKSKKNGK